MCIIIDANSLSHVFNKEDEKHKDFKPVLDWILNGQGKVVYGGTKYLNEISSKYLGILSALRVANKTVNVPAARVDKEEVKVAAMIEHADFDDQHIVGLLRASGCRLICSLDARAYPYFHHNLFFTSKKRPKIYSSKKNSDLLVSSNMAGICVPCSVLNQKIKNALSSKVSDIASKKTNK